MKQRDQTLLPEGVTPHKLRHTFASILVACGEDPASLMAKLGHTNPTFTLPVYTHLMRRGPAERAQMKALVSRGLAIPMTAGPASAAPDLSSPDTRRPWNDIRRWGLRAGVGRGRTSECSAAVCAFTEPHGGVGRRGGGMDLRLDRTNRSRPSGRS